MAFKIVLIIALLAQIAAAFLALRLNFRYRIYSAWVMLSVAALVLAILRLSTLMDIWQQPPDLFENPWLWTTTLTSLLGSILFLAGLALIEPFFVEIGRAQETLWREHHKLQRAVEATEDELRVARHIQKQLLPQAAPDMEGWDIAGESVAAEWTSGDYFDYVPLKNGTTAFVVADVCGHGLGPALLMSSARASIRAIARNVDNGGQLLTAANQAVREDSERGFVTAFIAQISSASRHIRYAASGQPAFLLRADGTRQTIEADTPPLGVVPDLEVPCRDLGPLAPGDILILVTDGILETTNESGVLFGEQRLWETVIQHGHGSAEQIVSALFEAARAFAADQPQNDDVTAVIVKAVGSDGFPD